MAGKKMTCIRSLKGFTLIEILVAILILAVILSVLYSSYSWTLRNIEETESQAAIYEMARVALNRISDDLHASFFYNRPFPSSSEDEKPEPPGFLGEDLNTGGRDADSLRFTSRAHILFDEEQQEAPRAIISYYVRENETEGGFTLFRSDTPEFERMPEPGEGGFVLCDGLYSVNFTYHDDTGEKHDKWDSSIEPFLNRLPVMVDISLEFINRSDAESPFRFTTAVSLPMARNEYGKVS